MANVQSDEYGRIRLSNDRTAENRGSGQNGFRRPVSGSYGSSAPSTSQSNSSGSSFLRKGLIVGAVVIGLSLLKHWY